MLCSALEESSHLVRTTDQPGLDLVVHLDDGGAVHLHSLVLAASSQYFNTLGQVRHQMYHCARWCIHQTHTNMSTTKVGRTEGRQNIRLGNKSRVIGRSRVGKLNDL